MNIRELKKRYPRRCQPPTGYGDWIDWADAQYAHGLIQKECRRCGRWFFPQEAAKHVTCTADSSSAEQP